MTTASTSLLPAIKFDDILGHARFQALADSAVNHHERIRLLEIENGQLREEVARLRAECELAREFRLLMHDRMARAEGH